MNNTRTASKGIGFLGLLTIAFVVLKLCKVISWSWWWVLCPLWGGGVLILFLVLLVIILNVLFS